MLLRPVRRCVVQRRPSSSSSRRWRFELPPARDAPFKVVFAGEAHFLAALPLTRAALDELAVDGVELAQVPAEELSKALEDAQCCIPFMERLDGALIRGAPDLRLVVQFGVGLEGVDAGACARAGVALSNCPADASRNSDATAEHAVFLALAMLRGGVDALAGRFRDRVLGGLPLPRQLRGKRVLVVGHGAVGRALAAKLRGPWGADVVLAHAHRDWGDGEAPPGADVAAGRPGVLAALPGADVVVLCCPLTDDTRDFVDAAFCAALKPGAVLVNVGRGPIVSRTAVLGALRADPAFSFASDVGVGDATRPSEPWDPADELSAHPRAYFTPHVGGYTDVSYANMSRVVAGAIANVKAREPPDVWLNRDAEE